MEEALIDYLWHHPPDGPGWGVVTAQLVTLAGRTVAFEAGRWKVFCEAVEAWNSAKGGKP